MSDQAAHYSAIMRMIAALPPWDNKNAEEPTTLEDAAGETLDAGEFAILLCTGGPAVRIVGELDQGEPCRAWLEYRYWGTPWTRWFDASSDTLCKYAANFFFGE